MTNILIRNVEVWGWGASRWDIKCRDGRIVQLGQDLSTLDAEVVSTEACAVIPGLHDHHLHLMAMAAKLHSTDLEGEQSPRSLRDRLQREHGQHAPGEWLRVVGYETDGPLLDRWQLDELLSERPCRVQHRSGHLWILNSRACLTLQLENVHLPGVERDDRGVVTGRIFGMDEWLGLKLNTTPPTNLAAVGRQLSAYGVTGVTDATPYTSRAHLTFLGAAHRSGDIPQRIVAMTATGVDAPGDVTGVTIGPVKIMLEDRDLLPIDELSAQMQRSHRAGRPVAVHCVTRAAAVFAVAAWEVAGPMPGDRMEHASVLPEETALRLAMLGVAVSTQPAFLRARGDSYLRNVDPDDLQDLYPCSSLLSKGIVVAGSTDAPFGPDSPWEAMRSAVERRTRGGRGIGSHERLRRAQALELFLARPMELGQLRTIAVNEPADMCLLDCSISRLLEDLDSTHIVSTSVGGEFAYGG